MKSMHIQYIIYLEKLKNVYTIYIQESPTAFIDRIDPIQNLYSFCTDCLDSDL